MMFIIIASFYVSKVHEVVVHRLKKIEKLIYSLLENSLVRYLIKSILVIAFSYKKSDITNS